MLLTVQSYDETRYVYKLFTNTDMSLANQHTSMMDRLRKSKLEYYDDDEIEIILLSDDTSQH